MNKKPYQRPTIHPVMLCQHHHLLDNSPEANQRPTATFMENPDIEGE